MKIPYRPVVGRVKNISLNPQFFYFAGAMRDGTLPRIYDGHYEISISQKLIPWLTKVIKPILVKTLKIPESKIRIKIDSNTPRLVIYSKKSYNTIAEILNHPTGKNFWETPEIIRKHFELQKWYIRGFFDSEGEVPHVEEYLRHRFRTKPRLRVRIHQAWRDKTGCPVLEDLREMIAKFGINSKVCEAGKNKNSIKYELSITGKEVYKFYQNIGSSHPLKKYRFRLLFELNSLRRNTSPLNWRLA